MPETIARLAERLTGLEADAAILTSEANRPMVIGAQVIAADDVLAALDRALLSLPPRIGERRRFPFGQYRGLGFGIVLDPHFSPDVFLEGATTRCDRLSANHHGPRAMLNALERLANGYVSKIATVRQELAIAEAQLRDYQARFGECFPHEAYWGELTALCDAPRTCLSGVSPPPDGDTAPTMLDLADRIKALRTERTIEALPQRIGARRSSMAAEPITDRIRRRIELALTA